MDKKLLLLLILCVQHPATLYSQWTRQDSIWLQDVLSGKKDLQLNPEVLKAIEEGVFIRTEPPALQGESRPSPSQYPIVKDFSEYLKSTENKKDTDSLWIPPAVFIRLGLNEPFPKHQISKALYVPKGEKTYPSGFRFSADDMLKYIFMPSERAKARNRKRATAWKSY